MKNRAGYGGPENLPEVWRVALPAATLVAFLMLSMSAGAEEVGRGALLERYGELPLRFEPNLGQSSREVKFLGRGTGYTLFLTPTEAVLVLRKRSAISDLPSAGIRNSKTENRKPALPEELLPLAADNEQPTAGEGPFPIHNRQSPIENPTAPAVLRMKLLGANPAPKVTGLDELPGKSNYLIGRKRHRWRTEVPNFARVLYDDVYPGVDLIFYGNRRLLEFDFVVAPGGGPKAIRLDVALTPGPSPQGRGWPVGPGEGSSGAPVRIDASGDLVIATDGGEVRFHKPIVYQVQPSVDSGQWSVATHRGLRTAVNRQFLDGRYVLRVSATDDHQTSVGNHQFEVAFETGPYDPAKPLVIDPVMSYSTYLGGTGLDYVYGIAVDSSGSAYVTGHTNSADFPVANAAQAASGGGTCGSELDIYPCDDAFVAKLNAAGTGLDYSTYIGGSGEDYGVGIAVDASGHAFVAGYTNSTDFPVINPAQAVRAGGNDAFLAKLSSNGSALLYATYVGGSGDDYGHGIATGSDGDASVTGFTSSNDFPVTSGAVQGVYGGAAYDAFVSRLDVTGSALVYSSYLGGRGEDYGADIALHGNGEAFVAGYTSSADFPVADAFQQVYGGGTCGGGSSTFPCFDAFVSKLNAEGTALVYSTYLGGSGGDYGYALAVDAEGSAYATGLTTSADFPATEGALQTTGGATVDAFVTKLSPAGESAVYSTYLGGVDGESGLDIAVDTAGNSYVVGYAYGSGFPMASPLQATNGGFFDAFLAKLNAAGTALVFSTYLGGSGNERAHGIALDSSRNAYVAGGTFSADFPVTASAFQPAYGGGSYEAFVTKLANLALPVVTPQTLSMTCPDQGVGTMSPPETVMLGNGGDAELVLGTPIVSGDFVLTAGCGSALPPGEYCRLEVTFAPTEMGLRAGSVTIEHNAYGSPFVIDLTGNGVAAPVVTFSATSLAFSDQALGTTSPVQILTLGNVGEAVLNIASITATGDFAQTNTCGVYLPVGATCQIAVTFTPITPGLVAGGIMIADNALGSPHLVSLSGMGMGPAVDFSLESLVFDPQLVGASSTPATVALTNTGNLPLEIFGITASGDFAQSNSCGTRLGAGAICTINVTFTPSASGECPGTLTLTHNAMGSPHGITLLGIGIAPVVTLSPPEIVFGEQPVGMTSAPQTLRLANTGSAALSVAGVQATGDFAQTNNCGSAVLAGGECAIEITFTPSQAGLRLGNALITHNPTLESSTVTLSGVGTDFSVSASPTKATTSVGASTSYTLTLAFLGGFDEEVALSCRGAPKASTCSISPAIVTSQGATSATATVTVATTGRTMMPVVTDRGGRFSPAASRGVGLTTVLLAFLSMAVLRLGRRAWTGVVAVCLLALFWCACGGEGVGTAPRPSGGTPSGTYTLTLTATSASLTRSTSVTLTVN